MKIGFTTLACPGWDLGQIIRCALDNGYDGVDFRGYRGQLVLYELPEFTTGLDRTIAAFRQAKIEVPCLSTSARMFCRTEAQAQASLKEVSAYAELARRMGAGLLRVFGGGLEKTPLEEAIPKAVAHLRVLADAAARCGVGLVIETHDDWIATSSLARVMAQVDRANVGVLWDINHPFQLAGESLEESYRNLGRYTRYTHVKDSRKLADGKLQYTLPGEGQVDIRRAVALLKSGGYDGYLTVEWEKQWHPDLPEPEVALPAYARALREAIAGA
jgi:sugar phosphate isomerase/epimerase